MPYSSKQTNKDVWWWYHQKKKKNEDINLFWEKKGTESCQFSSNGAMFKRQ